MTNERHKLISIITLVLLCLNIFCSGSACAYADSISAASSVSFTSDNHDASTDATDCCAMCDEHSCLSHYSFICNAQIHTFSVQKRNQYLQAEESSLSSIVLKSIPKPPCSYSLA